MALECEILETWRREPVRVMHVRLADGREAVRKEFSGAQQDFLRELEALRQLRSPRWTGILHAEWEDGHAVLVREYVEGSTLREALPSADRQRRLRWFAEIAAALGELHQAGFVHGDLKPENVLVPSQDQDRVVLTDFGLSGRGGGVRASGTAFYVAPEQLLGWPLDLRSDLFALGVLGTELFLGALPDDPAPFYARFPRESFLEALSLATGDGDPLLPMIRRLTATDPRSRHHSVVELLAELETSVGPASDVPAPAHQAARRLRSLGELRQVLDAWAAESTPEPLGVQCEDEESRAQVRAEIRFLAVRHGWRVHEGGPVEVESAESGREDPPLVHLADCTQEIVEGWASWRWRSRSPWPRIVLLVPAPTDTEQRSPRPSWLQVHPASRLESGAVVRITSHDWVPMMCCLQSSSVSEISWSSAPRNPSPL